MNFVILPICRVVEKSGKVYEGPLNGGSRVIRHFRSSSVPIPLAMENMVYSSATPSIKAALQQVAHTNEDGASGGSLSSPRKQPPPKPKRDPNTRLSASYEAVSAGLVMAAKESPTPEGYGSPAGSPPKSQLSPTDPAGISPLLVFRRYNRWCFFCASVLLPNALTFSVFNCFFYHFPQPCPSLVPTVMTTQP